MSPQKKTKNTDNWLKGRESKKRGILPEYHLIVTEGKNTEPLYFKALKEHINSIYPGRIEMKIEGEGACTLSLLDRAIGYATKYPNPLKHIWLVYDKDDFPSDDFDNTEFKCQAYSNEKRSYHALWSNQCIELWFLLHFSFMQSDIHRKEYKPKLDKELIAQGKGKYKKNRSDMFDLLWPYKDTAIQNAKRLNEINKGKTISESAPGTRVYEIFEYLDYYLK